MYDVFCYGAISLDISGKLVKTGGKVNQSEATDYRLSPGGDATLVAITLAGLGKKVALAGGPVGDDPMGIYIRETLEKMGITILAPSLGKTSIATILLGENGRRSVVTYREETAESEIPVFEAAVADSKYLYVDGCYANNSKVLGRIAREKRIPSLLNFDPASASVAKCFDTVILSEEASLTIAPRPKEVAARLHGIINGLAIITLGERGCISFDGALESFPAYAVTAVDTTGAGAAFAAGFIDARLGGKSTANSIRFASAAGAYKALARGSYRIFTEGEIEAFIRSRQ